MTPEEIGVHILYIREGIDDLKKDKKAQWDRLDMHSAEIVTLKERSKSDARKSGAGAGSIFGAIGGFIGGLMSGLFGGN